MAARALASIALLLCLNLLLFTLVSSTYCPPTVPTTKPKGGHKPKTTACPRDAIKLGVCADLLNLVNVILGTPPKSPCCSLLGDLADLEAAVCLCTAIKANVLGNNLNVPVSLELLLNYCGKKVPHGFKCA